MVNGYDAVPHLQNQLTKIYNIHQNQELLDSGGHVDKARLIACSANKAARWMQPAPNEVKELKNNVCRTAIRLRLGIKKLSKSFSCRCRCGKNAMGGDHFFTCTHLKEGPISLRHNLVKKALIRYIQLANVNTVDLDDT